MRLSAVNRSLCQPSTSGRTYLTASVHPLRRGRRPALRHHRPPRLRPSRVAEGDEGEGDKDEDKIEFVDDDEWLTVDPVHIMWNKPELGPLERRVGLDFWDGLLEKNPDPDAMEYWFNEPPGGWHLKPEKMRKAPQVYVRIDTAEHPGKDRLPVHEIQAGQVFQGTIIKTMLYHGAQVDIGAELDGLIPIQDQLQWDPVLGELDLGMSLEVRVHKVWDRTLFRFPIQLVPTDPELAAKLMKPDAWEAPMDLRDPKMSCEEIARISGRDYKANDYTLGSIPDEVDGVYHDITWNEVGNANFLPYLDKLAARLIK